MPKTDRLTIQNRWLGPEELKELADFGRKREALYPAWEKERLNQLLDQFRDWCFNKSLPRCLRIALGRCL
jgi:hypothetical protein